MPVCGEPLIPGKRFCRSCGLALPAAPAPAAARSSPAAAEQAGEASGPVAERRVCSVLFCDVVGFTPLSEARDPEVVRELLSRYFEVAETVIGRYGGLVEKFIGDAVMAVWGTPTASEEDAERAVRAGLDLVTAVRLLGHEAGVPGLAARAGVVTGEVAVTLSAANQGMVAGDAVNTAARVQAAAEPGEVLVDGATYRLAGSAVGFADTGGHRLKGKAEAQELWRATRVLSAVGGSQRVDGLEAPLTGRDAELRTIKDLFHAAAERKVPRLVLVSGPAGVGKSRLGWEFEKYADGLAGSVWWHRGRCLAYGEGVAFWALAEIVRQRLGIAEEDPAEVAAGKLAAGLDQFVPDPAERAYIGPRLGRLLGVAATGDSGAALSREELFAGWRLFFERLAAESSGRPAGRGRPVRRQRPAGIPGPSHRLGQEPAGLRAGLRPPGARPRPARVRHRAQPEHADPGPARPGIDGPAGRRASPRDAPRPRGRRSPARPRASRCSRWKPCAP